jgi:manganese transport protein
MKSLKQCHWARRKAANYTLIHVVETVGAMIYGGDDHETSVDEKLLEEYKEFCQKKDLK